MTIHDDEGHPHVHVVIRGYNEGGKQVGLYPKHLKELQSYAPALSLFTFVSTLVNFSLIFPASSFFHFSCCFLKLTCCLSHIRNSLLLYLLQ